MFFSKIFSLIKILVNFVYKFLKTFPKNTKHSKQKFNDLEKNLMIFYSFCETFLFFCLKNFFPLSFHKTFYILFIESIATTILPPIHSTTTIQSKYPTTTATNLWSNTTNPSSEQWPTTGFHNS